MYSPGNQSKQRPVGRVSLQLLLLLSVTLDSFTLENTSFSRVHKYLFVSLHRRHSNGRQLCIVGVRLSIDESHTSMLPPPTPSGRGYSLPDGDLLSNQLLYLPNT